jgi:tetratricopeptide (TPR) repeat protein
MTDASKVTDDSLQTLLAAIHSNDAEGMAVALDDMGERRGPAAGPAIVAALDPPLTETMLAALRARAQTLQTAQAWSQFASAALIVGRDEVTLEAAGAALKIDPATPTAALMLSAAAGRRGEYDAALHALEDLISRVPAAKDDPFFIFQSAQAEWGRKNPKAVFAIVDTALPRLTAAGLGFDSQILRARALEALPERSAEVVDSWEGILATVLTPAQADQARLGLIVALRRAERYDECLGQLDQGIAATADPKLRAAWLEFRPAVMRAKGDIDGALAALGDLVARATEWTERLRLRLEQADAVTSVGRWKEAATHFDAALAEIPTDVPEAGQQRMQVQLLKAQALASHDIDSVLPDLDELDANWPAPAWPLSIDLRIGGLVAAERIPEALAWLEDRISRTPSLARHPAAFQLRGDMHMKLKRLDEAMQFYEQAVELPLDLADPRALGARLMSAYVIQQWTAARTAYEGLCELDPASAANENVRVIAATAYLRLGELESALKLTDGAPPATPQMRALNDLTRAEALIRLDRFDEALATTHDALKRYESMSAAEVAPEFPISLNVWRAQVFNAREEFEAARDAASSAIDVPDQPGAPLEGLTAFLRIGARMQRSLAWFKLNKKTEAQQDVDEAIAAFERLRESAVLKVLERATEFERFETSLWYAKGALLHSESRSEEALAAYTRAQRLERHGNAAAVARGYALSLTGAFEKALPIFEGAWASASSDKERADALAGKGRALVRLQKFDDAILALQGALDTRLTEPDNDPDVFELLGIAYEALKRTAAAGRAFRRAWDLTAKEKRSANLARGVTAAELALNDPAAALKFLDELPSRLKDDRTLLFNRALALDALGRRPAAIACLVGAKNAGLDRAQQVLDRLDAPAGLGRWTHHWFGAQARGVRQAIGTVLLIIAATGLAAPLFQWWLHGKLDWYLLLLPSGVALVLLALPNMKSITVEAAGLTLSAEPLSATGRDAAVVTAPETFTIPMVPTMAVTASETKPAAV